MVILDLNFLFQHERNGRDGKGKSLAFTVTSCLSILSAFLLTDGPLFIRPDPEGLLSSPATPVWPSLLRAVEIPEGGARRANS